MPGRLVTAVYVVSIVLALLWGNGSDALAAAALTGVLVARALVAHRLRTGTPFRPRTPEADAK